MLTVKRVVSGIQPSGNLHIGNLFGSLSKWRGLSELAEKSYFFVADLHALTEVVPADVRARQIDDMLMMIAACGVDPERANIFRQSDVLYHSELAWYLMCTARTGWLDRMVQYKDKKGSETSVSAGLYTYPVLQAADILLYGATHVPVGEDQFQHLQLTRDIAQSFNSAYGETFTLPEGLITSVGGRIMSLFDPTKKMSKSDPNPDHRIDLLDSASEIARKIKRATTDSEMLPDTFAELSERHAARNLVTIYAAAAQLTPDDAMNELQGAGFGKLKTRLTDALVTTLSPIAARYREMDADRDEVVKRLSWGADSVLRDAEDVMMRVRTALYG